MAPPPFSAFHDEQRPVVVRVLAASLPPDDVEAAMIVTALGAVAGPAEDGR